MKKLVTLVICSLLILSCGGKKNTFTSEDNDFKIKDTSTVNKIFLANKSNQTVLLTKENGRWRLNGKYDARMDLLQNLFYTIKNIEVKEFVPKAAVENQLKLLAVAGTKVEIYQNDELAKVYYVGGPTQDHMGTYFLMEGSENPYVVYLPGHRGYLTNHFTPIEEEWKSRVIFSHHISEIKSVQVDFVKTPELSWELINVDDNHLQLRDVMRNQILSPFDTIAAKNILKEFKALGFEGYAKINSGRLDSVKTKYGLCKITLNTKQGGKRTLDLYQIPVQEGTYSPAGNPITVDVDRMYGIIDGEIQTICQYFTYDMVTAPITFFMPKQPNKGKINQGKQN